jgi:hypothetical protein
MVRKTYSRRGNRKELMVTLAYLPYDSGKPPPTKEMRDIVNHCKSRGRQLITRCNANAHHILCGSTDINPRKSLVEYLVTSNLDVLNRENKPTSLISHRKVIDLTLWTNHIGDLVRDWHICDKPSLSNHRYILFQVWNEHVDKITFHDTKRTDWESYNDDLTVDLEATLHYTLGTGCTAGR